MKKYTFGFVNEFVHYKFSTNALSVEQAKKSFERSLKEKGFAHPKRINLKISPLVI